MCGMKLLWRGPPAVIFSHFPRFGDPKSPVSSAFQFKLANQRSRRIRKLFPKFFKYVLILYPDPEINYFQPVVICFGVNFEEIFIFMIDFSSRWNKIRPKSIRCFKCSCLLICVRRGDQVRPHNFRIMSLQGDRAGCVRVCDEHHH